MKVRLINNVFLDGEVREAGSEYEIKDEAQLTSLLERGSVVDAATPEPEAPEFSVEGDLTEEVRTPNGDVFKRFESPDGVTYTVNDSEVVSEDAYTRAKQDVVAHNIEQERLASQGQPEAPAQGEATTDSAPLDVTPPPAGTQPTPEQIAQDLAASEGSQPSGGA